MGGEECDERKRGEGEERGWKGKERVEGEKEGVRGGGGERRWVEGRGWEGGEEGGDGGVSGI